MEAGRILSADVLDIIFDARNKAYGAYDLRKHYERRLIKAFLTTVLVVVLLLIAYYLAAAMHPQHAKKIDVTDVFLDKIPDAKIEPPKPIVIPPVKQEVIQVKTKMFAKFLITPDKDVPDNERPPEQNDLTDAKIGRINQDGKDFDGIEAPPVDGAKGLVDMPKKPDEEDKVFIRVEIESQYPGGLTAWSAFLNRHLSVPQEAIDAGIQGTFAIQFIVDTDGNVSDVTALDGPEVLRKVAVNVIKKSGKWTPAIQNGKKVKSYKRQPITFRFEQ